MSQSVTPYLTVKGAAEAIAFYQKAFRRHGKHAHASAGRQAAPPRRLGH